MATEQSTTPALSDETVIWRYLRLDSFLELLTCQLMQVRIDAFDDPAEGTSGFPNFHVTQNVLEKLRLPATCADLEQIVRRARVQAVATCWYEYRRESYGMWRVYSRYGQSVAIESTVGALKSVFSRGPIAAEGVATRIERVRYEPLPPIVDDISTLFLHKRREYEYESEVRSICEFPHEVGSKVVGQATLLQDLNLLIRRVIIAPGARPTFIHAIRTLVTAMFNIGKLRFEGRIDRSELDEGVVIQG